MLTAGSGQPRTQRKVVENIATHGHSRDRARPMCGKRIDRHPAEHGHRVTAVGPST
jgi:hypothetical protein